MTDAESVLSAPFGRFSEGPCTVWLVESTPGSKRPYDTAMRLLADFTFTGPTGPGGKVEQWTAARCAVVSGASIPWWATSLLRRTPYVGNFRRAAVIHDACVKAAKQEYCDAEDKDEAWPKLQKKRRKADRVFLFACLAGRCKVEEAAVFYLAVAYRTLKKSQDEQDADCKEGRMEEGGIWKGEAEPKKRKRIQKLGKDIDDEYKGKSLELKVADRVHEAVHELLSD